MPSVPHMFDKGSVPVLFKSLQFATARMPLIANNIANAETPRFQPKDLDEVSFHKQLRESIDSRRKGNPRLWSFRGGRNVTVNHDGTLNARVIDDPIVGPMRHSQNNLSIDYEMAKLAKNTILHNSMVEMLKHEYDVIGQAIRGRTT